MERFVQDNFVTVRIQVRENPAPMERFGVNWTPTIVLLDPDGKERFRIEGFLDTPDFLAQLTLGLGHIAFALQDWPGAQRRLMEVLDLYPNTEAAAEAQYWLGVTKYKASNDPSALKETAAAFKQRYSDSSWAKKASVWG